jgi:hypothetical protein
MSVEKQPFLFEVGGCDVGKNLESLFFSVIAEVALDFIVIAVLLDEDREDVVDGLEDLMPEWRDVLVLEVVMVLEVDEQCERVEEDVEVA